MFSVLDDQIGSKIADGFYSKIFEYGEQDPQKSNYLIKAMDVKNISKLKQYLVDFALAFNNKHPFVLNYRGLDIKEVNEGDIKYNIYIKMKKMKKSLNTFIKELIDKDQNLPLKNVVWIFYSLSSALSYLESKGIVHSNITSHSVLFDKNDTIQLGGFTFSRYKPWHKSEKKVYQSYWPPERFLKPYGDQKVDKENAFKSDVWCLGKLILDICLRKQNLQKECGEENVNKKVKEDLQEVEQNHKKIYDEKLIKLLKRVLDANLENRPSFKEICDDLEDNYPEFGLLKIKNGGSNREPLNFMDIDVSEIGQEDQIRDEHSFDQLEDDMVEEIEKKSEEQKSMEKDIRMLRSTILNLKNNFQDCGQDIKAKVKKVTDHKISHTENSKENTVDGFLHKSGTLLAALDDSLRQLEFNRYKIMTCIQKIIKDAPCILPIAEKSVPQPVHFPQLSTNAYQGQKPNFSWCSDSFGLNEKNLSKGHENLGVYFESNSHETMTCFEKFRKEAAPCNLPKPSCSWCSDSFGLNEKNLSKGHENLGVHFQSYEKGNASQNFI